MFNKNILTLALALGLFSLIGNCSSASLKQDEECAKDAYSQLKDDTKNVKSMSDLKKDEPQLKQSLSQIKQDDPCKKAL